MDDHVIRTLLLLTLLLLPGCQSLRKFNARRELPPDARIVDDLDARRARSDEEPPPRGTRPEKSETQLVGWEDEPGAASTGRVDTPTAAAGVKPKRFDWSHFVPGIRRRRAIPLPRTDEGSERPAATTPSDGFEGI